MPRSIHLRLLLVVFTLITAACGGDDDATPTEPTTLPPVTETFSGTLTVNGGVTHPFNSLISGPVTATLTALSPDSTVTIGLSLGTWNGVACQVVIADDLAIQGRVVTGRATSGGSLCVRVYDVGKLVEPTSYEIQVAHP
jgi:hypothetical protein